MVAPPRYGSPEEPLDGPYFSTIEFIRDWVDKFNSVNDPERN